MLSGIARGAKRLNIINVVGTAFTQRNDVVYCQFFLFTAPQASPIIFFTKAFPFLFGKTASIAEYCTAFIIRVYRRLGVVTIPPPFDSSVLVNVLIPSSSHSLIYMVLIFMSPFSAVICAAALIFPVPLSKALIVILFVFFTPYLVVSPYLFWIVLAPLSRESVSKFSIYLSPGSRSFQCFFSIIPVPYFGLFAKSFRIFPTSFSSFFIQFFSVFCLIFSLVFSPARFAIIAQAVTITFSLSKLFNNPFLLAPFTSLGVHLASFKLKNKPPAATFDGRQSHQKTKSGQREYRYNNTYLVFLQSLSVRLA